VITGEEREAEDEGVAALGAVVGTAVGTAVATGGSWPAHKPASANEARLKHINLRIPIAILLTSNWIRQK